MKNREKFAKEILDIACKGGGVAVTRDNKVVCCNDIDCESCIFDRCDKHIGRSQGCYDRVREWAESEYIEKPTLTNNERKFLEIIDPKFKYMVKNPDGWITFFENEPLKDTTHKYWSRSDNLYLNIFLGTGLFNNVNFDMVQCEDEKPWLIEDLKKLEVKEDTND